MKAASEYFSGDELAANVWMNKYALKDSDGNLYELTPTDMHHRIAGEVARIESKYPNPLSEEEVFNVINKFKYIVPQNFLCKIVGEPVSYTNLGLNFVFFISGSSD